jgi:hypothetical protein
VSAATTAPLATLAQRMGSDCAAAVDPLEIAAVLEADGMDDESAADYGCPDVFELAERLYAMTARSQVPPGPVQDDRWRTHAPRHILRGLAFGLPGLCYAAAAPDLAGPADIGVLLLALLASWGASQALAYLAYARLGRADRKAAASVLRCGATGCAAVIAAATAATGLVLHADSAALWLAAGQTAYLLAAIASLMPVGRPRPRAARFDTDGEWWLLCVLAPGALGASADLLTGAAPSAPGYFWICGALTVAAAIVLAGVRTAALTRSAGGTSGPAASTVTLRELATAAAYAAFGMLAGLLLTFTSIAGIAGRAPAWLLAPGGTAAICAPLSISMGPAEWLLFGYRRRVYLLLQRSPDMAAFSAGARRALRRSVAGYLVILTALTAAFGLLSGPVTAVAGRAAVPGWTTPAGPAATASAAADAAPRARRAGPRLVSTAWQPIAGLPPRRQAQPGRHHARLRAHQRSSFSPGAGPPPLATRPSARQAHSQEPTPRLHGAGTPPRTAAPRARRHTSRPRLRGTGTPPLTAAPLRQNRPAGHPSEALLPGAGTPPRTARLPHQPHPRPHRSPLPTARTSAPAHHPVKRAWPPRLRGAGSPQLATWAAPRRHRPAHHRLRPLLAGARAPALTVLARGAGTGAPPGAARPLPGPRPPGLATGLAPRCAYLALGTALYLALVLQSCGAGAVPLCLAALTLAVQATLTWAVPADRAAAALPVIQLGCYGGLLASLLGYARTALAKATRHA